MKPYKFSVEEEPGSGRKGGLQHGAGKASASKKGESGAGTTVAKE